MVWLTKTDSRNFATVSATLSHPCWMHFLPASRTPFESLESAFLSFFFTQRQKSRRTLLPSNGTAAAVAAAVVYLRGSGRYLSLLVTRKTSQLDTTALDDGRRRIYCLWPNEQLFCFYRPEAAADSGPFITAVRAM